jgi:hypothetical protein
MKKTSETIYQLLLYLYPKNYREEYGELMLQLFKDLEQEYTNKMEDKLSFWGLILEDFIFSLIKEHFDNITNSIFQPMNNTKPLAVLNIIATIISFAALVLLSNSFQYSLINGGNDLIFWIIQTLVSFTLCIFNALFAYDLLRKNKKADKNTITFALISLHVCVWIIISFLGEVFATELLFPIGLFGFIFLIWKLSANFVKKVTVVLSIITIIVAVYAWNKGFEEDYCLMVGNRAHQEAVKQGKPTMIEPKERYKKDFTQIAVSWQAHLDCHYTYNVFTAVKETYFSK